MLLLDASLDNSHKLSESDLSFLKPDEFAARYKHGAKLGSGAFADVFRVKDNVSKCERALKVLQTSNESVPWLQPEVALFREARALKHAKHENVVELISILRVPQSSNGSNVFAAAGNNSSSKDNGHPGSCWSLLLEYVECGNLTQVICKQMSHPHSKHYSNVQAMTWALDIATGLTHLHGLNPMIIHRDLKLENILLQKPTAASNSSSSSRKFPVAKISDLGLHVMLDKPNRPFMIRSEGGCPLLVFGQQQQQQHVRTMSAGSGGSSSEGACTGGPCGCRKHTAVPPALAAAAAAAVGDARRSTADQQDVMVPCNTIKPAQAIHSSDARAIKHVAFIDAPMQQQQQQQVMQVSSLYADVTAAINGSSSSDAAVQIGPVTPPATKAYQQQQQQQFLPLTINTIRRLSIPLSDNGSSGRDLIRDAARSPSGDHSVHSIPITLEPNPAKGASAPRFHRASICATAMVGSSVEGAAAAADHPAAAAAAGKSDISIILAAANSERDYQVSISHPGDTRSRRNSYCTNSKPQTPRGGLAAAAAAPAGDISNHSGLAAAAAAAGLGDKSYPSTPKSGRSMSGRSMAEFPTAASMLWEDMMEDFGCQELLDGDAYGGCLSTPLAYDLTHHTGSCMYMAPEVYKGEPYNESVDVFSLGVIIYELFSRTLLLYTHTPANSPADSMRYAERVSEGYRPGRPKTIATEIWQIIERCWDHDPCARPSAAWVKQQLQQLLDAELAAAAASAGSGGLRGMLRRGKPASGPRQTVLLSNQIVPGPPSSNSTSDSSNEAARMAPGIITSVAACKDPQTVPKQAGTADSSPKQASCGCVIC